MRTFWAVWWTAFLLTAASGVFAARNFPRPETRVEKAYQVYIRNLIKDRPENQEYPRPVNREVPFNNNQCLGYCPGCCPCCKDNPLYVEPVKP